MADVKKFFKNIFVYKGPHKEHDFTMPESVEKNIWEDQSATKNSGPSEAQPISTSIAENLEFLKVKYNSMINSDVILREITITVRGKKYDAVLVLIDGMSSSELINNYLLKPLMVEQPMKESIEENDRVKTIGALATSVNPPSRQGRQGRLPLQSKNNKRVRPIAKMKTQDFDLSDYLYDTLIPQCNINKVTDFDSLLPSVSFGDCALLVDTISTAFVADTKGFNMRGISAPNNETVIRGSQEAFVENLRTNTSMLRRIIRNENLVIESSTVRKCFKHISYHMLHEKYC